MSRRDLYGRSVSFGRPSTSLGYLDKTDHSTCLHSLCDDCLGRVMQATKIAKRRPKCPDCQRYYPIPAGADIDYYDDLEGDPLRFRDSREFSSLYQPYGRKPPSPGCIQCEYISRAPYSDLHRHPKSAIASRKLLGLDNERGFSDVSVYGKRYGTRVGSPDAGRYAYGNDYGDQALYGQRYTGLERPVTRGRQLAFSSHSYKVNEPEVSVYSRDYTDVSGQGLKRSLVPNLRGSQSRLGFAGDYRGASSVHWQNDDDTYLYSTARAPTTKVSYTIPKYVIYGQPEIISLTVLEWYDGRMSRNGDHEIVAALERPDGTTRPLRVVQHGGGRYIIEFCEAFHGRYRLKLFIDGQRVAQSPFFIEVIDGWLMGKRMKVGTTVIRAKDVRDGNLDGESKGTVIKATEEFNRGWWISVQWDYGGSVCQYNMNRYSCPIKLYDFYTN